MDIKAKLKARFAPIPVKLHDASIDGVLFVRRLKMPEMQAYFDAVRSEDGKAGQQHAEQAMLLQLAVCDKAGKRVFDTPEETELLGDCWLPLYEKITEIMFPGAGAAENFTTPGPTPSSG